MTSKVLHAWSLALFSASSGSASAHHSAAQFDFEQTVRIEGVVKEMRVANPHIALFLEVTDGKGTRVIEYEGHTSTGAAGGRIWSIPGMRSALTSRRRARAKTAGTSRVSF